MTVPAVQSVPVLRIQVTQAHTGLYEAVLQLIMHELPRRYVQEGGAWVCIPYRSLLAGDSTGWWVELQLYSAGADGHPVVQADGTLQLDIGTYRIML